MTKFLLKFVITPVKKFTRSWDQFLFVEISPLPLAIYRIILGSMVITNLLSLWPSRAVWWSEKGMLTSQGAVNYFGPRLNILAWLPQNENVLNLVFIVVLFSALSLAFGFFSRLSALLLFIGLTSFSHRNPLILDSSDTLLRVSTFWLIWVPSGATLSADRTLYQERQARKKLVAAKATSPAWSVRFLQIQISVLYLIAFLWKLQGSQWLDGTAVGTTLNLEEFHRFPLPEFLFSPSWIHILTWGTLLVEGSLGVLIWIPVLRPWVILAGLGLHLGIDYSMNIPLFEWAMIGSLVLFVNEDVIRRYKTAIDAIRTLLPLKST